MITTSLREAFRKVVVRRGIGPLGRYVHATSSHTQFGDWLRAHDTDLEFLTRYDMYQYINTSIIKGEPIDYLEFGVYKGDTFRRWAALNRAPSSRFHGFDSFEGLPEDWAGPFNSMPKGTFDVGGALPEIDDPRVRFVKGWFQDSLPEFLRGFEPLNRLVIHCDADLYSSTLYVLCKLDEHLKPGTLIIFDEFNGITEFKALTDYTTSFLKQYKVLCKAGRDCDQLAVEVT